MADSVSAAISRFAPQRVNHSQNLNNKKGKIMEMTKNKRSQGRGTKSLTKSLFNSIVLGKEIIMKKIKRSNGRGTKSLSKSLFNSIVFGKEIIMKKIKMKKRFGLNRQKSGEILDNVLSGTKAGFKAILNFEPPIERKKMDNQKSKSTFSATLPALILGVAVFLGSPAWAAKYVTDPTTGKVVTAPEYGGTLTYVNMLEPASIDPAIVLIASHAIGLVNEKLGIPNWALDRDVHDYRTIWLPESAIIGRLAESWEMPDATTYIFKIRKGVHWHNKAPMNGRELTASDIEYNQHRIWGLGSGFTEPAGNAPLYPYVKNSEGLLNIESVTATDKWTIVFKLKEPILGTLKDITVQEPNFVLAPEVIEQYGDVTDWRNVVGTGPFELTDYVEGSSITYTKNPDYWGFDEKYPENRLPYVDEIRALIMKERATIVALMRTGKADFIGKAGQSQLTSVDAAMSLQRTNPELNLWPFSYFAETAMTFDNQKAPWNDIRVRQAIQMAIDLETINQTYMQGWADTTPTGPVGRALMEYTTPFEEWPEEIKKTYRYDPAGAEALLDEAGYPRGADGIRFQTVYEHYEPYDLNYYLTVMEYLRAIGIGVEMEVKDRASHSALKRDPEIRQGMLTEVSNRDTPPIGSISQAYSKAYNPPNVNDPIYDAMYVAAAAATTVEEQMRLVAEADMYIIEKHWWIVGPRVPLFAVTQPWVIGYNGEAEFGSNDYVFLSRLWIDSELKEAMG